MFDGAFRRSKYAIVSIGVVLVAAACGSNQQGSAAGAPRSPGQIPATASQYSWPEPTSVSTLGRTEEYSTIGLTLAPPPATMTAAISAKDAYSACQKKAPCPQGSGGPAIYLALATNKLPGHDSTPRLIYVLRWEGIPFESDGPAGGSPVPATPSVWLTMIDASTGESLGAHQTTEAGA